MSPMYGLRCTRCGAMYESGMPSARCTDCGGVLEVVYRLDDVRETISRRVLERRTPGVWKYWELLPLRNRQDVTSLGEGGTFLQRCSELSRGLDITDLFLKTETTNPTGSFIDRGTAVAVSMAKELGYRSVSCGTTGNLAASLVAYAARGSLQCSVFIAVHRNIDVGKLYQILAHSARVDVAPDPDTAMRRASSLGPGNRAVTPYDPYFLEGIKTTAYEVCEQLQWSAPDWLVVPMGNGGLLSMMWRALNEFMEVGLVGEVDTRIVGVQAKGCAPIVRAFHTGAAEVEEAPRGNTIAMDIGVRRPACGALALRALRESDGIAVAVSDREILDGASMLAKQEGVFAEPASATTIAALGHLRGEGVIDRSDRVVCVITGMGLKYPEMTRTLVRGRTKLEHLLSQVEDRKYTSKLGTTKLHILRILEHGESYGYEIWKRLRSEYGVSISIPSVYQHLSELRSIGLIAEARPGRPLRGRPRTIYVLTEQGLWVITHLGVDGRGH